MDPEGILYGSIIKERNTKTNKSIGIGKKDIPFKFGNVEINPGSWIYVDFNGWVVSKKELKL